MVSKQQQFGLKIYNIVGYLVYLAGVVIWITFTE